MFRRLVKEGSSAARGHGLGLSGPPCFGSSASALARRRLGTPSPALPLASGRPVRTGVPDSILQAFLSSASSPASNPSTRRCVASACCALASRWITTSASQRGSPASGEPGKAGLTKQPTLQMITYKDFNPNDPDMILPELYFQRRPILRKLDNDLVTDLDGRSKWTVEEDTRLTFFSLLDLMVVNQLDECALGIALREGNLLISWKTGKFALRKCTRYQVNPARVQQDCANLHDIIVRFVERRHGKGAKDLLPFEVKDWLAKLKAECVSMKMIYLHPMFLTWLDRALFRTVADVCVKMPVLFKQNSDFKTKLKSVVRRLPYVGPQSDSTKELKEIVSKNRSLSAWKPHRDNEKKRHEKNAKSKKMRQQNLLNKAATQPPPPQPQPQPLNKGNKAASQPPPPQPQPQPLIKSKKAAAQAQLQKPADPAAIPQVPSAAEVALTETASQPPPQRQPLHKSKKATAQAQLQPQKKGKEPANLAAIPQVPSAAEVALIEGCLLIALNRDGINHLYDIPKDLKNLVSLKAMVKMLHFEFPEFECKLLDLLEENGIWYVMMMATILKVPKQKLKAIIRQDEAQLAWHNGKRGR